MNLVLDTAFVSWNHKPGRTDDTFGNLQSPGRRQGVYLCFLVGNALGLTCNMDGGSDAMTATTLHSYVMRPKRIVRCLMLPDSYVMVLKAPVVQGVLWVIFAIAHHDIITDVVICTVKKLLLLLAAAVDHNSVYVTDT